MLSESLTKVLDLGAWKLGLAAWIFTGYSPLKLRKTGHLIRLVDDEEIPHGTVEFRGAEEMQNELLMLLQSMMIETVGFETSVSDDEGFVDIWLPTNHFDRNWLINQVVNASDPNERRDPWWLDNAIEHYFVPAYIRPDALSPTLLERRGYTSFVYPQEPNKLIESGMIFTTSADKPSSPSRFEQDVPKVDAGNNSEDQPKILYKPSVVKPYKNNGFFLWLYEKIQSLADDIPVKQFEGHDPIEGWDKHCMPRPSGAIARDIALSEEGQNRFYTELVSNRDLRYSTSGEGSVVLPDGGKVILRKSLGDSVARWFDLTEEGHKYQAYIKSKKS
jgi:hypothetical protein